MLLTLFKIDHNLISEETVKHVLELVHSNTTKVAERSKALSCVCELYSSEKLPSEIKNLIIKALSHPVDDPKVREMVVKKCSDVLLKNGPDEKILKLVLNFYNDVKDNVRETVAERLQAIMSSSVDFITEESVKILSTVSTDRVSLKVRLAGIRSIAHVYKTHRSQSHLPLMKELLRQLLKVYWSFAMSKGSKGELTDSEESGRIEIMMAFQTVIVGGDSVDAEERAVNMTNIWLDDDPQIEKIIRRMLLELYSMRKPFERSLEMIMDQSVEEGPIEESIKSSLNATCVKAKDSMNESLMKVMLQNDNLLDIGRKMTYLEMSVKQRVKSQKKFIESVRSADSTINLTALSELCKRSTDCIMEPKTVIKLFKLHSNSTEEAKKERILNLINYFSTTHEYSFANLEVFEVVVSVLEKGDTVKEMLLLLKNIGSLLNQVYEGRKQAEEDENAELDLSILNRFCSVLEDLIQGDDYKLSKVRTLSQLL